MKRELHQERPIINYRYMIIIGGRHGGVVCLSIIRLATCPGGGVRRLPFDGWDRFQHPVTLSAGRVESDNGWINGLLQKRKVSKPVTQVFLM